MVGAADGDGGAEFRVLDAEQADEFALEMLERAQTRGVVVEVPDRAAEQVEEVGHGVVGFGDEFEQFDKIRGERDALVVAAQAFVRLGQLGFAQGVEFALAAASDADLALEEEVEPAGEAALRLARAFRHGLELPMRGGEPREDEARVGKLGLAEQKGGSGLHARGTPLVAGICDLEKGFAAVRVARYRSRPFSKAMPEETQQPLAVDASNLRTSYANVCRIAQTPNEVIVDFGMNPNFFGQILDEPLKLDNRVILSHDAAKRLCIHLTATIQNFEARYGAIELDVTKRLKNQPAS